MRQPGDVLLAVCQTPGTIEHWNYPSGLSFPSGTPGNRITLQARKGDAIVINAGGDFAGARTPGSGFWTQSGLSGADVAKNIWRSVSTFSGGAQNMMGMWIEFDHPHQIVRAGSMANLRAAYSSTNSPTGYCGPCVHKDTDGRVYIRWQVPHPDKYSTDNKWSVNTWHGHPEAVSGGKLIYPLNQDPNNYPIYLYRVSSNVVGFNCGESGQYIKVGAGINSCGFRHALTGNHIWCDRGTHYTWHAFVQTATSGSGNKRDYFCNRTRCTDGSKLHLSRSEWKFGGWLEGIRTVWFGMFNSSSASEIFAKDCTIGDYHELMTGAGGANQFRWRNCTFINIFDDGIQARHDMSRVEMGYCMFLNSAYGGFGEGGVAEGNDPNPGGWFVHHNVIDLRQERGTNWRAQPHPMFPYGTHSADGVTPKRYYNNLIIYGPDCEEELGVFLSHCPDGGNNTNTSIMHEVFNNIVLRVYLEGTKRYDAVSSLGAQYSDGFKNRSDYVNGRQTVRYSAAFSNELFDYNLYWRPSSMTVNGMLRGYARGKGQTLSNYADLAAWQASSEFTLSKSGGTYRGAYSAGFDGNSTDTKPNLASIDNYPIERFQYRPAVTAAITVAKSGSLSGANWWTTPPTWGDAYFSWNDGTITLAPSPWKGPLDPNGTTLPVGVQNP